MNSKSKLIKGAIVAAIGAVLWIGVEMAKSAIPWYERDDSFEMAVKAIPLIAILLIGFGVIDIIAALVSDAYANKTVTPVETPQIPAIVQCGSCGLRVSAETKVCPKCKSEIMLRR